MKQAEDTRTMELAGLDLASSKPATGGGMLSLAELLQQRDALADKVKRIQPRGAYRGAVKIGSLGHRLRAQTGKTQGEFAKLAGISERSLRTWEQAGEPWRETPKVHGAVVSALASLGVSYLAERQKLLQRRAVAYRHPLSGDTWSGRGLMPKWMRASLDDAGYTLDQLRA